LTDAEERNVNLVIEGVDGSSHSDRPKDNSANEESKGEDKSDDSFFKEFQKHMEDSLLN
jgi:hypothetical protein